MLIYNPEENKAIFMETYSFIMGDINSKVSNDPFIFEDPIINSTNNQYEIRIKNQYNIFEDDSTAFSPRFTYNKTEDQDIKYLLCPYMSNQRNKLNTCD